MRQNFILQNFLNALKVLDWSPLYACMDLDYAVYLFTSSFKNVLDLHAPWICFQERKKFNPWISQETIESIKLRDKATQLTIQGEDASIAWAEYRHLSKEQNQ